MGRSGEQPRLAPREVRFASVPKTSTGKIQKHLLRAQAKSASAIG